MKVKLTAKYLLGFLIVAFFSIAVVAETETSTATSSQEELEEVPLAVKGYDIVSYRVEYKAEPGTPKYQAIYNGERYLFVNEDHQQRFSEYPEQFLPQFNGYCAQSVAESKLVEADPELFVVEDGKLFLFSQADAIDEWKKNGQQSYSSAQDNWHYVAEKRDHQHQVQEKWRSEGKVKLFTF